MLVPRPICPGVTAQLPDLAARGLLAPGAGHVPWGAQNWGMLGSAGSCSLPAPGARAHSQNTAQTWLMCMAGTTGADGLTFRTISTVKTEVKPMSKYPRIWGCKHQNWVRFG